MPHHGQVPPTVEHGAEFHTDVTRELFIPANEGFVAAGAPSVLGQFSVITGGADLDEPTVYFAIKVPDDFVSFLTLKAVWSCGVAAGNMYWRIKADWAAAGEIYTTHSEDGAMGVTATGGGNILNVQEPFDPILFVDLALGDYIGILFERDGSHANDTLDTTVKLVGLLFTYMAEQ